MRQSSSTDEFWTTKTKQLQQMNIYSDFSPAPLGAGLGPIQTVGILSEKDVMKASGSRKSQRTNLN